jgi:putative spermidine/putrescine transport system permease protein
MTDAASTPAPAATPPYPIAWRALDLADGVVERLLPRMADSYAPLAMLAPAIVLVGLLVIGLALVGEQSFHTLDRTTFLLAKSYTLENYRLLLARSHYRDLTERAIEAALVVAACGIVLEFPYAYFMVRTRSAFTKKLLLCCVFAPFLLGVVVRGYAWLVVLGRDGLINEALQAMGLGRLSIMYSMSAVLIGLVQLYLPLAIIIIASGLTAIGTEIDEAAQSLGAHWTRAIATVILPMAVPALRNAFVILLTLVFSDLAIPSILGGGRADFIANAIHDTYMEAGDRGLGGALCVATTLLSTALILLISVPQAVSAWRRKVPAS